MKAYIIAILVALLLISGCKSAPEQEEVVEVEAPVVEEVVPETVVEEVVPETDISAQVAEISAIPVDDKVQLLINGCKAGNVGLCTALKTKYNIDMMPGEDEPAVEIDAADDSATEE